MSLFPPKPPFTRDTASQKVRLAEDAWNSRDPERVAQAYTLDSRWRNRDQFVNGREDIVQFLTQKWQKERHYRLIKSLWAFHENRIAVRFAYEWQDQAGQWWRSYGNENWQFAPNGQMSSRHASINDVQILEEERVLCWSGESRPEDFPDMEVLGL
ncbi:MULTISPECIES: nuclear transport factor 2 family protein [unclassified Saccharibacter]|uniref:nuclear transport factor 2 family protein n=1 Tax=unclassified Saccharibacter TaxID=2648722 RepID=UPI0013232E15|nr:MULTISPECIES: nuclear transport factor 2 family protein [unclassified Saccharibacter]MXV34971.1 DUF1348 family protein [Saccharibacter sp. EH611]MXV57483.1 DUF1348 family protein [Saccharibacter sp. EH70]MXV64656.1 DUF1348 family protein [Saccharibacter sp. EH60]